MMTGSKAAQRLRTVIQVSLVATLAFVLVGLTTATLFAQPQPTGTSEEKKPLHVEVQKAIVNNIGSGLIAAGIVSGVSAIAAGIAVAYVGAAAVGAVSEKPEVFGRTIVFVALGEGIAIFGLAIAFVILLNVGGMLKLCS